MDHLSTRSLFSFTLISMLTLGLVFIGCGSDEQPVPGNDSGKTTASEKKENSGNGPASLLEVLHLTDKLRVEYKCSTYGNSMGKLYWSEAYQWDGLQFKCDEEQSLDEGTSKAKQRHLKITGTLAQDHKSVVELTVNVDTSWPGTDKKHHEEFTWRNIPIDSMSEKPGKSWRESPYLAYSINIKTDEVPTFVDGWTETNVWGKGEADTGISDQNQMIHLYMPSEADSICSLKISFGKK